MFRWGTWSPAGTAPSASRSWVGARGLRSTLMRTTVSPSMWASSSANLRPALQRSIITMMTKEPWPSQVRVAKYYLGNWLCKTWQQVWILEKLCTFGLFSIISHSCNFLRCRSTILLRFWTSICCCWLDILFQPRSSVCPTRMRVGLMMNAGMLLPSIRKLIFGAPVITRGLTGKCLSTVKWEPMGPTRRPSVSLMSEKGMFLWMWLSILKSAVCVIATACWWRWWTGVQVSW